MPGKSYYGLVFLVLLLLTALPAFAQYNAEKRAHLSAEAQRLTTQTIPGACEPGQATADLDINNVRARLYNMGHLFWRGSGNVYTVPKGGTANSIFASGIWIGGLVNGERRFAGSTYGPYEYFPGPLDDQGNPPDDCTLYDHIYSIRRADLFAYEQTGTASADLLAWPAHLGAPVEDGDGIEGNYDLAAGDRPKLFGDQTLWWVMNDAGGEKDWSETEAIGLEVQVTAYAYATDDALDNTTFYRYKLINKGNDPLEEAYFGIWSDPDLGSAIDDMVGSDTTLDMGFVYNGTDDDLGSDGYGNMPPALGYTFLQGPVANPDNKDNDRDGEVDEAGERHGMSVFLTYYGSNDAQGNPAGQTDGPYQYLQGLWRDGTPLTYGDHGYGGETPTKYMYPGDPVSLSFWTEENINGNGLRNPPSERRFLMSTGPFTLQPGESDEVAYAIVWSRSTNRLSSIVQLRADTRMARAVFQGEPYDRPPFPPAPLAPTLISPFDNSTGIVTHTSFSWRPSEDADDYLLQVATDPDFNNITVNHVNVEQTETEHQLKNNTTYYWHVQATNVNGNSPWSPAQSFTTGTTRQPDPSFESFETIANAAGPLVPITGAAADFAGFPVPEPPDQRQQVNDGIWLIHTADNGSHSSYQTFVERTAINFAFGIAPYDFEIRFTEEGSLAYDPFCTHRTFPIPFELWRIGGGTPDDPSDDVRMVPYIADNDFNGAFNLNTTASIHTGGSCFLNHADHTVSDANDDPQTDLIYWATPTDTSPGEAGYQAWKRAAEALNGGDDGSFFGMLANYNAIRRMVLVNLNGGDVDAGNYNQAMPEKGTIFRIRTNDPLSLSFEANLAGLNNVPSVNTSATGSATLSGFPATMSLEGSFVNLQGDFIAAILYRGNPEDSVFVYTPRDSLHLHVDLASDRRSGTIHAEDDSFFLDSDAWYVVIESTAFPRGELRGQLLPAPNAPPNAPQLLAPVDGATVYVRGPKNAIFETTWNQAGDPNANRVGYQWQLATDADFSQILINANTGTDTHYETSIRYLDMMLDNLGFDTNQSQTFYHRVVASDGSLLAFSEVRMLRMVRGILTTTEHENLPERFALLGNYPNPFNPTTTVRFDLPQAAEVTLTVYNVLGRKVMTVGGQTLAAGAGRQMQVDGSRLASGLYLYRITAAAPQTTWHETGRFVLVK